MFESFGKAQDGWSKDLARSKSNILPSIRTFFSNRVRCTDKKTDRCWRSPTPGPGKETALARIDRVMTSPDANFYTAFATSTDSRCLSSASATSDTGGRPARPGKAAIISNAIFDDSFNVKPESRTPNFGDSNPSPDTETQSVGAIRAAETLPTISNTPFSSTETQKPIYNRHDQSVLAEAIHTARSEIGQTTIFDGMLQFPFQDATGKWQPCSGNDNTDRHLNFDTYLAVSRQASRPLFGIPHGDRKGKKPVYRGFVENFDDLPSPVTAFKAEIPPPGPPASSHRNSNTSSTALKCICTPNDAKLALELYLQSTEKQHRQLRKGLRRVGGMKYVLGISAEDRDLVQRLSQLHLTVEELAALVMAQEMVSSVTLTAIHRLMDNALKPVSEHVFTLSGEMTALSMACNGWSRRQRRATKQRMRQNWAPRMRALSARVDQAEAWSQLVGIRITRAGLEW